MALSQHFTRQITVNVTPFVPKAHTPFEREAMPSEPAIQSRLKLLNRSLRAKGIEVRAESPKWAIVQGMLSRGDRAISLALEKLSRPTLGEWHQAVRATGLKPEEYLAKRPPEEPLAWQLIVS
jgi:hypothetical protein